MLQELLAPRDQFLNHSRISAHPKESFNQIFEIYFHRLHSYL